MVNLNTFKTEHITHYDYNLLRLEHGNSIDPTWICWKTQCFSIIKCSANKGYLDLTTKVLKGFSLVVFNSL